MKDRADVQRAKARSMMGGDLATAAAQRKTMGSEMGAKPETVVGRVAKGPDDRYVRPGAPIQTERPSVMLAKGGKVPAVPRARMAQAMAKKAESKGEQRMEMRKDMRQDKKAVAKGVHAHERHLHKGQPLTKLKDGGKVKKPYATDSLNDKNDSTSPDFEGNLRDMPDMAMREGETIKEFNERQYKAERAGKVPGWNKESRDDYEMESGRKPRGAAYAKGGKVACLAAGGAAKYRRGEAKPVPKTPRGGNPQY